MPDAGRFYAVDSEGGVYTGDEGGGMSGVFYCFQDSFTYSFEGCLEGAGDIEWFELRYDSEGRDILLRVDMSGGTE